MSNNTPDIKHVTIHITQTTQASSHPPGKGFGLPSAPESLCILTCPKSCHLLLTLRKEQRQPDVFKAAVLALRLFLFLNDSPTETVRLSSQLATRASRAHLSAGKTLLSFRQADARKRRLLFSFDAKVCLALRRRYRSEEQSRFLPQENISGTGSEQSCDRCCGTKSHGKCHGAV